MELLRCTSPPVKWESYLILVPNRILKVGDSALAMADICAWICSSGISGD